MSEDLKESEKPNSTEDFDFSEDFTEEKPVPPELSANLSELMATKEMSSSKRGPITPSLRVTSENDTFITFVSSTPIHNNVHAGENNQPYDYFKDVPPSEYGQKIHELLAEISSDPAFGVTQDSLEYRIQGYENISVVSVLIASINASFIGALEREKEDAAEEEWMFELAGMMGYIAFALSLMVVLIISFQVIIGRRMDLMRSKFFWKNDSISNQRSLSYFFLQVSSILTLACGLFLTGSLIDFNGGFYVSTAVGFFSILCIVWMVQIQYAVYADIIDHPLRTVYGWNNIERRLKLSNWHQKLRSIHVRLKTLTHDYLHIPGQKEFQVSKNKDIIARLEYNINLLQQYILEELCAWERPENADEEIEITRRPTLGRSVSRKSTTDPSPSLEQSNSRKSEVLSPSFGRSISRKIPNEPIEKKTTTYCAFVNDLFQSLSRSPRFISSLFCYQSAERAKKRRQIPGSVLRPSRSGRKYSRGSVGVRST